jgi:hypothetical protein
VGKGFRVALVRSRTTALRASSVALGAMLAACPQLRDEDFRTLPRAGLVRNDAGGGGAGAGATGPPPERDACVAPAVGARALRTALAHRYAFDGTGSVVIDTIAGSNATLVGATLDGNGGVTLDGDDYVDLPNRVLSASDDQTIEAWLTWKGGRAWQRIFDFGSSDAGEGARGNGRTYLYLTPRSPEDAIVLAYSSSGYAGETRSSADVRFPVDTLAHVAVVVDSRTDNLSLYLDGRPIATKTLAQRLSAIDDVNCWLGLAQFETDPGLNATLTEFRLYHRALTASEIELSHGLGPDAEL